MEYSPISKQLTQILPKSMKKTQGIYFTPPDCVEQTMNLIAQYLPPEKNPQLNILEPACGSGEYLTALRNTFPTATVTGIELNKTIFDSIVPLFQSPTIRLVNANYLQTSPNNETYDLIIGNPPFYVLKKEEVNKKYHKYFDGRPNIFILFIAESLDKLKKGGILSFILPKGFLNCVYYDKMRNYLDIHCEILHILNCENGKYMDTQQETVIFIVKKRITEYLVLSPSPPSPFIWNINNFTIFATESNLKKYKELFDGATTLHELGYVATVGNVVWNQVKPILTEEDEGVGTSSQLIYSTDIVNGKFTPKKYKNQEKHNFIRRRGTTRPMIVINRGYGTGEYNFHYCLIDNGNREYLVENHLICLEKPDNEQTREQQISQYGNIIRSFHNEKTLEFIRTYFGNSAINTNELMNILPIYVEDKNAIPIPAKTT